MLERLRNDVVFKCPSPLCLGHISTTSGLPLKNAFRPIRGISSQMLFGFFIGLSRSRKLVPLGLPPIQSPFVGFLGMPNCITALSNLRRSNLCNSRRSRELICSAMCFYPSFTLRSHSNMESLVLKHDYLLIPQLSTLDHFRQRT